MYLNLDYHDDQMQAELETAWADFRRPSAQRPTSRERIEDGALHAYHSTLASTDDIQQARRLYFEYLNTHKL